MERRTVRYMVTGALLIGSAGLTWRACGTKVVNSNVMSPEPIRGLSPPPESDEEAQAEQER